MSNSIKRTPRTSRTGGVVVTGDRLQYVALRHLRWGGGWLEPGDEVPIEDGRNYGMMVRHGDIQAVIEPPVRRGKKAVAK